MAWNKKRIGALLIDGSADLSLGIIVAATAGYFLNVTLSWWVIMVGVVGALSPDIDVLYFLVTSGVRNTDNLYKHRLIFHYPLLFLPSAIFIVGFLSLLVWPFTGVFITTVFVTAAFLHFVHDTFLHGWGIPWLYPISKHQIALFCHTRAGRPLPKIFIFSMDALHYIRAEYKDPSLYELFYRFPPHPWMYVIIVIHLVGLLIILSQNILP